MHTFQIKQVQAPLFGVVEAPNQSPWLSTFSAASSLVTVSIDDHALDIIADEIELDAEGLLADAERYVQGLYRSKARGMSGSRLGELGEVLSFVVGRSRGQDIVRVVSWQHGKGQVVKGAVFPQPDFLVRAAGAISAVEVKSTEVFDFLDLRDKVAKWTWLQPCTSAAVCRARALPQLAYVGQSFAPQQHSLVLPKGTIVPFPVSGGVAIAFLALDGRIDSLRSDSRYRTPRQCRTAGRACWTCVPVGCHIVLVTMPNAPGFLALGGGYDGDQTWFLAYRGWAQALAARDIFSARDRLSRLCELTVAWLARRTEPGSDAVRAFWSAYLRFATRAKGLDIELPGPLAEIDPREYGVEWESVPLAEPVARESTEEGVSAWLAQGADTLPFSASIQLPLPESMTVTLWKDFLYFRLMSREWWTSVLVESSEVASAIAMRLIAACLRIVGGPLLPPNWSVPLQEVKAGVGDRAISLGWQLMPPDVESVEWRRLRSYWEIGVLKRFYSMWSVVKFGQLGARLHVLPDGRVTLRVHKSFLRHR